MANMTATAELFALHRIVAPPLVIMWPTSQYGSTHQPTTKVSRNSQPT